MGWFGESSAHKQWRYQKDTNEQLQNFNLENMEIEQQYNLQNMARQYWYEQQNMAQQFEYNKQAFNMENAYNTPLAQRQRMMAAGLNPNWSDSSAIGQMDSAVSPVSPSSSSPSGSVTGSSSPGGQTGVQDLLGVAQMAMMNKQAQKLQSDIDLNKANENKVNTETDLNRIEASERPLNYSSNRQTQQSARQLNYTQQFLNQSMTALNEVQTSIANEQLEYFEKEKESVINELMSRYNLQKAQALDLFYTQKARLDNIIADTNEKSARAYKERVEGDLAPKYLHVEQEKVNVEKGKLKLGYAQLQELHRHNVTEEQYNKFYYNSLGELNNSITYKNNVSNWIAYQEYIIYKNAKKEGIPQNMAYEVLQNLRWKTYDYMESVKSKSHQTDREDEKVWGDYIIDAFSLDPK